MISVQQFINTTLRTKKDMDGHYGAQCWDYFAYFEKLAGYPITYCTRSGYVKDIWNDRYTNGVLNNFDEVSVKNLKKGDWIIWVTSPYGSGNSHIAMFVEYVGNRVKVIGQNQDSSQNAIMATLGLGGIGGCLRPHCWISSPSITSVNTNVKLLQTAMNMDGIQITLRNTIDNNMLDKLKKINIYAYPHTTYNRYPNLVKFVQKRLGQTQDGRYGPKTKNAILNFQKSKGIKADGILGVKTFIELCK